jgi:transposase
MHHREKKSVREIVPRATSLSRNTVRKYLRIDKAEPPKYRRLSVPTKLAPFVEAVQQALAGRLAPAQEGAAHGQGAVCADRGAGYDGGYSRLTDYIRQWRAEGGGSRWAMPTCR